MRWLPSLGIGVLSGLATAVAALGASLLATEWHQVTDREGARGMLIGFVLIPAGFLAGFIVGTWVARVGAPSGLIALARSIGISLGLVAASLGMAWLTAEHPPTIDGRTLTLELEVRLPAAYPVQDSLQANEFRVGLSSSSRDRAYVTLDYPSAHRDSGYLVVRGTGDLRTTGLRDVSATYGPFEARHSPQYLPIPLAPRPSKADMEWSAWFALNRFMNGTEVPEAERVQVRYRVRLDDPG